MSLSSIFVCRRLRDRMFSTDKLKAFKYTLASKRFLLSFVAIASLLYAVFLVGDYLLSNETRRNFLPKWFSSASFKSTGVDISAISWAKHHSDVHASKLTDEISKAERQVLRKSEEKFVKSQLSKHKKYINNYTSCLTRRFAKFEHVLPVKFMRFPPAFGELMKKFHKECNSEVLGGKETCKVDPKKLAGRLFIQREPLSMTALKKELPDVRLGGLWSPPDCVPKFKLAVVIPFRKRESHLPVLLRQLHPVLQRQKLLYRIFVIEQADQYPFNRGKLMNVGFKEASKMFDFDCFVFHDVDLIPEDDRNDYGCPSSPRHLSVAIDKFDYNLPYAGIFGGVEMFTQDHYHLVNGFRNSYWGWGAEDDDLYKRTVKVGLQLTRPSSEYGRYIMIKHKQSESPPDRMDKLQVAESAISTDGLLSLHYKVLSVHENLLYTLVRVDLRMEDDMVY